MNFSKIQKVAAIAMIVCGFVLSSCQQEVDVPAPDVSFRTDKVDANAGSVFVTVKCSEAWTLSLEYSEDQINWADVNPIEGVGDKNNIILTYKANESEKERTLTLRIITASSLYRTCTLTQTAKSGTNPPDDGKEDPNDKPEDNPKDTIPQNSPAVGWLELPEMNEDGTGLEYYTHSFEMNGSKYRNYTFGWSQDDLVALWVAYPLCKFYTNKSVSRTNAWAYDPILGSELSPAPFEGYGEEYARGHQLPSADRLCCHEANAQTFYGTNMTPQLNKHNEGIWQNLESAVRTWANTSDTTYVVTGCIVEGSKRTTYDSDDKPITVPVAYYKALLRYHKASTISQWSCIAFYTEHKDYGNTDIKSLAISVDELEDIVGIDFFVNLPAKLGEEKAAALEAQDPKTVSIWW